MLVWRLFLQSVRWCPPKGIYEVILGREVYSKQLMTGKLGLNSPMVYPMMDALGAQKLKWILTSRGDRWWSNLANSK